MMKMRFSNSSLFFMINLMRWTLEMILATFRDVWRNTHGDHILQAHYHCQENWDDTLIKRGNWLPFVSQLFFVTVWFLGDFWEPYKIADRRFSPFLWYLQMHQEQSLRIFCPENLSYWQLKIMMYRKMRFL